MDFRAFATFCAAWEQRHRPPALRYFFCLLDLKGCGYLTQASLAGLWAGGWVGEAAVRSAEVRPTLPSSPSSHLLPCGACLCPLLSPAPPLLQVELYTFFREVHALWLALGQYEGTGLRR